MYRRRARSEDRRLLLPVKALRPHPPTDLTCVDAIALVDTGATPSGVTRGIADRLELASQGKRVIGSAHGDDQVRRHLFRLGRDPPEPASAFPVIYELDGFELRRGFRFEVILGMDVLSRCDLHLFPDGHREIGYGS